MNWDCVWRHPDSSEVPAEQRYRIKNLEWFMHKTFTQNCHSLQPASSQFWAWRRSGLYICGLDNGPVLGDRGLQTSQALVGGLAHVPLQLTLGEKVHSVQVGWVRGPRVQGPEDHFLWPQQLLHLYGHVGGGRIFLEYVRGPLSLSLHPGDDCVAQHLTVPVSPYLLLGVEEDGRHDVPIAADDPQGQDRCQELGGIDVEDISSVCGQLRVAGPVKGPVLLITEEHQARLVALQIWEKLLAILDCVGLHGLCQDMPLGELAWGHAELLGRLGHHQCGHIPLLGQDSHGDPWGCLNRPYKACEEPGSHFSVSPGLMLLPLGLALSLPGIVDPVDCCLGVHEPLDNVACSMAWACKFTDSNSRLVPSSLLCLEQNCGSVFFNSYPTSSFLLVNILLFLLLKDLDDVKHGLNLSHKPCYAFGVA